MYFYSVALFGALAALAHGAAVPSHYQVHEKRDSRVDGWVPIARFEGTLPIRIGLHQRNMHKGMDHLMRIADPMSPDYGKHWSKSEVLEEFGPSDETIRAVREWLIEHGIASYRIVLSDNRAWLAFDGTSSEVESLFKTEYYEYEHSPLGKRAVGTEAYHIPRHLSEHIELVSPGIKFAPRSAPPSLKPKPKKKRSGPKRHAPITHSKRYVNGSVFENFCSNFSTPVCLQSLYQIPPVEYTAPLANNTLGIFETVNYFQQTDLDLFYAAYAPQIPKGTGPTVVYIDAEPNDSNLINFLEQHKEEQTAINDVLEANLDLAVAYPLIYPQQVTLYQVDDPYIGQITPSGGGVPMDDFLDAVDGSFCTYSFQNQTGNDPFQDGKRPEPSGAPYNKEIIPGVSPYFGPLQCGTANLTNIVSISYGSAEQEYSLVYQQRVCNEIMKLSLQGHTFVVSSGDNGVGRRGGACLDKGRLFTPEFPQNCPAVLSVGSTRINPNASFYDQEIVAIDPVFSFTPGGGFSNAFPVPQYQQAAVNSYLSNHDPGYDFYNVTDYLSYDEMYNGKGHYNRNGRGIPDVSAIGYHFPNYAIGQFQPGVDGTSASAPLIASLLNRINEARLCAGKKTIGFVNPVLYQNPLIFNDITMGSNPSLSEESPCFGTGFHAVPGWDPASGLGTPNYPKLYEVFMALP